MGPEREKLALKVLTPQRFLRNTTSLGIPHQNDLGTSTDGTNGEFFKAFSCQKGILERASALHWLQVAPGKQMRRAGAELGGFPISLVALGGNQREMK